MKFDINQEKIRFEKDGKTVECDILFTFDSTDTMKSYVGYTDHAKAKNGRKNVYVSAYNPLKPRMELEDITDPNELEMVYDVLEQFDDRVNV